MLNQKLDHLIELELAIFEINHKKVAIKLEYLERFDLINRIIKIPRAPKYVLGVIRIEKGIIPLIDLELLLGLEKDLGKNSIALIISLKENIFAINVIKIPVVKKFDGEVDIKDYKSDLPKEWITGYVEDDEVIPILDPNQFWIGLGENEIVGEALKHSTEE